MDHHALVQVATFYFFTKLKVMLNSCYFIGAFSCHEAFVLWWSKKVLISAERSLLIVMIVIVNAITGTVSKYYPQTLADSWRTQWGVGLTPPEASRRFQQKCKTFLWFPSILSLSLPLSVGFKKLSIFCCFYSPSLTNFSCGFGFEIFLWLSNHCNSLDF